MSGCVASPVEIEIMPNSRITLQDALDSTLSITQMALHFAPEPIQGLLNGVTQLAISIRDTARQVNLCSDLAPSSSRHPLSDEKQQVRCHGIHPSCPGSRQRGCRSSEKGDVV
jgi:hypothetical protein